MKTSVHALLLGILMTAGEIAAPSIACAGVGIDIDVAPPPVRVETIPEPRGGYVWAPGFWEWRNRAHVWVPGHYVRERHGYHWVADHWVQRGAHWHHERGHWER